MANNVNPERLTKFDRSNDELLRFLFFSVAVAGKTAKIVAITINRLFAGVSSAEAYLSTSLRNKTLRGALEAQRIGKYNTLVGFVEAYLAKGLNLATCSVTELEELHGVGPKTARMFLQHSRPNQRFAVLDTHVLKFLKEIFPEKDFPKATPSGKKYLEIEKLYLDYLDRLDKARTNGVVTSKGTIFCKEDKDGNLDFAAFDLDLWRLYSGNKDDYA